ncbi:hypothetical protein [Kordia sp.]|uniref:hypothetical protein n=1 Tax=Kordia sp. TaxID=1965332 RepID=UPI0025C20B96|nr:hypothetical protein [Kordia sp.]MCH2195346.1 hypothetical protein [Kordia sp.]
METLQLEIYNTLVGKQSISGFEEFLYGCENILNNLEKNSFFYTILTINYRSESCLSELEQESRIQYGDDFIKVFILEQSCIKILQTKNVNTLYSILGKMIKEFDFNPDETYNISYKFRDYYYDLNVMFQNPFLEDTAIINPEIRNLALNILTKLEACTSYSSKKVIVFGEPEKILVKEIVQKPIIQEKTSLRKKIAQFFTKIANI